VGKQCGIAWMQARSLPPRQNLLCTFGRWPASHSHVAHARLASITQRALGRHAGDLGAHRTAQGPDSERRNLISHYRDKGQVEFVLESSECQFIGIEIKAAASVGLQDFKGLPRRAVISSRHRAV